jgi:hypothetical protein
VVIKASRRRIFVQPAHWSGILRQVLALEIFELAAVHDSFVVPKLVGICFTDKDNPAVVAQNHLTASDFKI